MEALPARVVLSACSEGGACRSLALPREGGPFRLEGLSLAAKLLRYFC
ncbi:hypothetical protein TthSNM66_22690 (plasmid) [Thermus thermophilus]|nr:hypothetical protein TthSNM66_22690 [Thermus thermophilus]